MLFTSIKIHRVYIKTIRIQDLSAKSAFGKKKTKIK